LFDVSESSVSTPGDSCDRDDDDDDQDDHLRLRLAGQEAPILVAQDAAARRSIHGTQQAPDECRLCTTDLVWISSKSHSSFVKQSLPAANALCYISQYGIIVTAKCTFNEFVLAILSSSSLDQSSIHPLYISQLVRCAV